MIQNWKDYYELCKPNVVLLMLLTSLIGMLLAVPGLPPLDLIVLGNLGIALCAGSAAAINHIVDHQVDLKMARTHSRPVAQGRVSQKKAAIFAGLIGVLGTLVLVLWVNTLTAILTVLSLLGYAVIYTLFLKRATPQNIVIGGLAGAAPPLLGWTAITGTVDGHALLLALIIFAWTPPHFWALAVHRKDEYANADIPMLPVTHGEKYTKLNIVLYTFILIVVSLLPFVTRMMGWLYLLGAIVLGVAYLYYVFVLFFSEKKERGMDAFWYSIVYLMALFVIMLLDHYLIEVVSFE